VGLFLIAEIDSPRGGVVRVPPDNLVLTMDAIAASPK